MNAFSLLSLSIPVGIPVEQPLNIDQLKTTSSYLLDSCISTVKPLPAISIVAVTLQLPAPACVLCMHNLDILKTIDFTLLIYKVTLANL